MADKADDIKGRAKEAAGALSDNDQLKREGQADRTAASAKGKVREATGKVEEGIDAVKERVQGRG